MKKVLAVVIAIAVVLGIGGYIAYEKHKNGLNFDVFNDPVIGRVFVGELGQSTVRLMR